MRHDSGRKLAFGCGLLVGVAVIGYLLLTHGPHASFWPKCLFHQWSGLHCAGCGMTRATHALLQGDVLTALRYNPLIMGLILTGVLALACEGIARWSGKNLPLRLHPSWRLVRGLVVLLIAFWIMRNIPNWPFTLLAPP